MKRKNAVMIIISVVILVVSLALLYRYLFPPSPDSQVKVIIPRPVDPEFNQEQLNVLKNDVVDFSQDINPTDSSAQQTPAQSSTTPQNSPQTQSQQLSGQATTREQGR